MNFTEIVDENTEIGDIRPGSYVSTFRRLPSTARRRLVDGGRRLVDGGHRASSS